jgi:plastocyanin
MFSPSLSLGLVLLPFVSAVVHDIQVGGEGKLAFSPEAIAAQPGDQVVFHFVSKNHTATQSAFANPCGPKDGGFDSGFMPVAANQTDNFPTHTITVQDTQPIWVYCKQTNPVSHCGMGMVFAVNCGTDGSPNSFTGFKQAALAFGAAQASASPSPAVAGGYGYAPPAASPAPAAASPANAGDAAPAMTTAAYGDYSIPAAPAASPVTQTVTLGSQVWTTTYNSYPGSADPTPAADAASAVHTVVVGGPGILAFNPPSIQAKPRDVVVFEFHQKNHTVTQSSFADPCRPLSGGFDSQFQPVPDNATTFPTWNFTVVDTSPVWAFCRQLVPSSHCGTGMVFAINAVESSERNFTAYQNVAKALNGTVAAANVPVPPGGSTTPANSAASTRVGGGVAVVAVAAVLGLFL